MKKWFGHVMLWCAVSASAMAAEVINAGVPGDNTDQMLRRFDADVTAKRPDLVVLLAGTNDMLNSYNQVPLARYRSNFDAMIAKARAAGIEVVLCEIPDAYQPYMEKRHKPGFFKEKSAAARIAQTNRLLKTLAARRKLPLVGTGFALGGASASANSFIRNQANSGAEDGVHPTPAGYRRLAQAVAVAIRERGWNPKRVVCMGDSITYGVHVKPEERYPDRLAELLAVPQAAQGRIADENGKGVAGVLLSDGVNFARSGADGRYTLRVRDPKGFVMVHLPSGYRAATWYRQMAAGRTEYDFALRRTEKRDGVAFLQIADTETVEMDWVPQVKRMAKYYGADFLVHTGDICRFPAIRLHREAINGETFGMPVYYTVGNHDLVPDNPDGSNYPEVLGPYWYSFEMGGVLFVAAPIHYGEVAMPYRMAAFADYLDKLLAEFPKGQPKVMLGHELLDQGDAPSFTTSGGKKIDLAENGFRAWFYGHWHKNIVKKHRGGLVSYSTANVNHGGIGHFPSSARLSRISQEGKVESKLIWTPAERQLFLTTPSGERAVADAAGLLTVSVIAYDAGSPVAELTCRVAFEGGEAAVALTRGSDWAYEGKIAVPPGQKRGTIYVKCRFGDGHEERLERQFSTLVPERAAAPRGECANLMGSAAHNPPTYPAWKRPMRMQWLTTLPGENRMTSPVVAEGLVFVATIDDANGEKGGIWALDAGTGAVRWQAKTGYSVSNSIAYGEGRIYAGDARGNVYAFEAATEKVVWRKTPETTGLPPMVSGGVYAAGAFCTGIRDELRVLEAATGKVRWRDAAWRRGEATPSTLTVADGKLYAASFWYGVRCYDMLTGRVLWQATTGDVAWQAATPVWAEGRLWVKGEKRLHVLDGGTGKLLKSSGEYKQMRSASPVLVTEGLLVMGMGEGGVVALDRETLEERWRFEPGEGKIDTTPYVHGGRGQEAGMVRMGDEVLIPGLDGVLYRVKLGDGRVVERVETGAPFGASPGVADGWVYCSDFAGRVMAFR